MTLPQPPPGVIPNSIDPENIQSTIIATLAVTLGAATLFTAVRIYTKAFIINSIALEDCSSPLSLEINMAGFVAYTILSAVKLQYGYGVHQWDVPISSAIKFFKLTFAAEILYNPLLFTVKLTILLQVQHIFAISSKLRFYLVQFMIWSNACWYFAYTFIVAFTCTPTAKSWDYELPGHCINSGPLAILATGPSVISDLIILTLPTFWVWKVQMARRRKLEVSLIFAMGYFATLFSILRLVFSLRFERDPDQTFIIAKAHNLWSSGEVAAGIMCGCLPTFPRFLSHISSKISVYLSACKAPRTQHPENSLRRTHQFRSTRTPMARGGGDVDDCLQLNNRSSDINDSLELNDHSSNFNIQDSFAGSTRLGNGSIAVTLSANSSINQSSLVVNDITNASSTLSISQQLWTLFMAMSLPPGVPLDRVPGLQPPPGVRPNFVNPENYQNKVIAECTVFLTIATVFTAAKLYTRAFIIKSIAWEDYVSFVAWVGYVAFTGLYATSLQYGIGVHQWNVPLSNVFEFLKLLDIGAIVYCPVIFATKLAILLQIQRIFVTSRNIRFYLVQSLIWINGLWYFINMFLTAFMCTPRAKIWDPAVPGHCFISFYVINYTSTIVNPVSDIFILILPISWAWKLQMAWKRKVEVTLIFGTGIIATVASIMRFVTNFRWGKEPDITWYANYESIWTLIEISVGIVCGCLPALPRAFALCKSTISSRVISYRSFIAGGSQSSRAKMLRVFGLRKSSAPGDTIDDYYQLREAGGDTTKASGEISESTGEV
ncbi:hypothetical protein JMJ35_009513 [Cladonia borealis]|uniref:Rhodopsin domain-containing protein n=1 Tax=Cladonia borealis TaxID=184061 RepID=A0AA39QV26_9LECA|nr:hypothetical protein JMJ35_009513 [Cladonia borealis]